MTPERYQQIKRLYQDAAELPEEERGAFLDKACGDDSELRLEVDKLVATIAGRPSKFLERPAVEQAAELLAGRRADLTVSVPSMAVGVQRSPRRCGPGRASQGPCDRVPVARSEGRERALPDPGQARRGWHGCRVPGVRPGS